MEGVSSEADKRSDVVVGNQDTALVPPAMNIVPPMPNADGAGGSTEASEQRQDVVLSEDESRGSRNPLARLNREAAGANDVAPVNLPSEPPTSNRPVSWYGDYVNLPGADNLPGQFTAFLDPTGDIHGKVRWIRLTRREPEETLRIRTSLAEQSASGQIFHALIDTGDRKAKKGNNNQGCVYFVGQQLTVSIGAKSSSLRSDQTITVALFEYSETKAINVLGWRKDHVEWFRFDLREVHPLYDPALPTIWGRPAELGNFEEQVNHFLQGRAERLASLPKHSEVDPANVVSEPRARLKRNVPEPEPTKPARPRSKSTAKPVRRKAAPVVVSSLSSSPSRRSRSRSPPRKHQHHYSRPSHHLEGGASSYTANPRAYAGVAQHLKMSLKAEWSDYKGDDSARKMCDWLEGEIASFIVNHLPPEPDPAGKRPFATLEQFLQHALTADWNDIKNNDVDKICSWLGHQIDKLTVSELFS